MTSVVVVSGSVRMEESEGAAVLAPFIEGMKAAGASVELVYVKRLKIKPCMGDFQCWDELPGQCRIKDDMQALYPRLRSADILVLATPVYVPLPGEMQNFMNRLVPLIDPYLLKRGDRTRARPNKDVRIRKIVLVSTCGWWEKGNFGTVVRIVREFSRDIGIEFAGAVLRPHAQWLAREKTKAEDVMSALRLAGRTLVESGELPKALLDRISQPLISEKEYRRRGNEGYERVRAGPSSVRSGCMRSSPYNPLASGEIPSRHSRRAWRRSSV